MASQTFYMHIIFLYQEYLCIPHSGKFFEGFNFHGQGNLLTFHVQFSLMRVMVPLHTAYFVGLIFTVQQ